MRQIQPGSLVGIECDERKNPVFQRHFQKRHDGTNTYVAFGPRLEVEYTVDLEIDCVGLVVREAARLEPEAPGRKYWEILFGKTLAVLWEKELKVILSKCFQRQVKT